MAVIGCWLPMDECPDWPTSRLLTDTQLQDQSAVLVDVALGQVREQTLALAYERDERTARGKVFFVGLEVVGQVVDARGEKRDLSFGRTGVLGVAAVGFKNLFDFFFGNVSIHKKQK